MERAMRAKMKITSVTRLEYGAEQVCMVAVYREGGYGEDGLDEDNTFAKFTPSGKLELTITNPALYGKLNPGEKYYIDFTKAE